MKYVFGNVPHPWDDFENWPDFDETSLPASRLAMQQAIKAYMKNGRLMEAASTYRVAGSELLRQMRRCLTGAHSSKIVGWAALQPGYHVQAWTRRKAYLDQTGGIPQERAGAFGALLSDYPGIKDALDACIDGKRQIGERPVSKLTRRDIYSSFRKNCRNVIEDAQNRYPLNTINGAKRSVYRYINQRLGCDCKAPALWFGHQALVELEVGRGVDSFNLDTLPFDRIYLDAHHVDVIATIVIRTPHGPKRIPIRRLWIVVLLDGLDGIVLGYSISWEEQVSADTVEEAFISACTPWRPGNLRYGRYEKGAGLPFGYIYGLPEAPIISVQMDNFRSHYSEIITGVVRKYLGCHIVFAPVGAWWAGARLERLFGVLEGAGIHVIAGSMGTGAHDRFRADNPVEVAQRDGVDWEEVQDRIEVLLTGENVRRGSGRSGMAPLEALANHLSHTDFQPVIRPEPTARSPRLGWEELTLRVAGCQKQGKRVRRPYVERHGVTFTNTTLASRFDWIGKPIHAWQRRRDGRMVAFDPDGHDLGVLLPMGRQSPVDLSTRTRRKIRSERNDSRTPDERDEVVEGLARLRARAIEDHNHKPFNISAAASDIAQVASEAARNGTPLTDDASSAEPTDVQKSRTPNVLPLLPGAPVVSFGRRPR